MGRCVSGILALLFIVSVLALCLNVQLGRSNPATIIVPDDYLTIQEAIDHANAGDTIFVRNGIYDEHIDIDKPLTLQGESNQNTILKLQKTIDGLFGIYIQASFVTISGFNMSRSSQSWTAILIGIDGRDSYCSNNTVRDNVLMNNGSHTETLTILNSGNNSILDNQIYCDKYGACIVGNQISSCIIGNNTLVGGWLGICIFYSSDNIISGNAVSQNSLIHYGDPYDGGAISLRNSSNNTVAGNTVANNERGIDLLASSDNRIYHNNFVNNTNQILLENEMTNSWDDGYPLGGNYWSDYKGTDLYSGPYQNETGNDGIGDTPRIIKANNKDKYPLMNPYWNPADVNRDLRVDIKDVLFVSRALGSCPSDPKWNPLCDVNNDLKVDIKDYYVVCKNYGKTYP